ncbi:hypothetical protein [Bradyrhizobium elkanii]|uniref:hypothetical protein n=1 Tax=Bradyrhizobium elkanii TaxID=29448 RepID=UPI00048A227F|nr:hypothetical protein [Bradyrhizobium elkanii]
MDPIDPLSANHHKVRDIGPLVDSDWEHGSRRASDVLIDILDYSGLPPTHFVPITRFSINREPSTAELGPEGPRDVLLVHHSQVGQMDETRASSSARPCHQQRLDFAPVIREGHWDHNRERFAPLELIQALDDEGLVPSAGRPTHILIEGVPYRAELQETDRGPRVRLYPVGRG